MLEMSTKDASFPSITYLPLGMLFKILVLTAASLAVLSASQDIEE